MWDLSLLSGNNEPIRVLEEGFRPAAVYEVSSILHFTLFSGTPLIRSPTDHLAVVMGRVKFHDWSELSDVLTDKSQFHF